VAFKFTETETPLRFDGKIQEKSRQKTSGKKPNYYEALIIAITLKKFFFCEKKNMPNNFFSSSLAIIVGCDIGVNVCRLQFVPLDGASKKIQQGD